MPAYVVSYDLTDGSDGEYKAVKEAICANSHNNLGIKRLETLWIVRSTEDTAQRLKTAIVRDIRRDKRIGRGFVGNRLDLVVGLLSAQSNPSPLSFHRTSRLDSC